MENYCDLAIEALKNYLINLIKQDNFCSARNVGNALEEVLRTERKIPKNKRGLRQLGEVCEEGCGSEQEY